MIDIVLVVLGEKPDYLKDTVSQIKKFNSLSAQIVIIADNILQFNNRDTEWADTQIISVQELEQTSNSSAFEKIFHNNYYDKFRGDFWAHTTKRFFVLEQYMATTNASVFHLENDNLLYYDVSANQEVLNQFDFLVPYFSEKEHVASVMFLKNYASINKLCDFILDSLNTSSKLNDMMILGKYMNKIKDNFFPIIDNECYESCAKEDFKTSAQVCPANHACCNFKHFQSIFDAAAIGQLFFGYNPENFCGQLIRENNPNCTIKYSNYDLVWMIDQSQRKTPFLKCKSNPEHKIKVNNLHMHCKNLKQLLL